MQIKTISHAASDRGKVRATNQDSGYCGYNLFFVADGMGGHAGGDIASAMVTQNVAQIDAPFESVDEAKIALTRAILGANDKLAATVKDHTELAGMGTTFSGLAVVGNQVVIAHIGDSRIYLVRDGKVRQVTKDHTFVQRLVDLGRITEEEALIHPRRSVLMRVLGDVEEKPELDIEVVETKPGDRWLLCSDGLSGVVPEGVLNNLLKSKHDPAEVTELLVGETLEFGAHDNVTVVVIDVLGRQVASDFVPVATFVGSADHPIAFVEGTEKRLLRIFNTRMLQNLLLNEIPDSEFAVESDEYLEYILSQTQKRIKFHRIRQSAVWALILITLAAALGLGYSYTQTRYYVGESDGMIAIYQGIRESLGPLKFSHLVRVTEHDVDVLGRFNRDLLDTTIPAESIKDAERIIHQLVGEQ